MEKNTGLMQTFKKQIEKFLNGVSVDMKAEQRKKDIRASGESAASLAVEAKDSEGKLTGRAYFEQQEYGRGPSRGKGVPWKAIRDWLDYKGIGDATARNGIAWAIKTKIDKRGTLRGRSPQYPGLGISQIIDKHRPRFIAEIGGHQLKAISEVLKNVK